MGYHAGFGGELRAHRHFGLYGDYRYTMIGFGGDDDVRKSLPGWIPGVGAPEAVARGIDVHVGRRVLFLNWAIGCGLSN